MTNINDEVNKQNVKTDKALSAVFNRLAKNIKTSSDAVIRNKGVLEQTVGAANSFAEYIKTVGFKTTYVPTLTIEQIENNEAFKLYQSTLANQGYDVKVTHAKGAKKDFNSCARFSKGTKLCLVAGLATMNPIAMIIGGVIGILGTLTYDSDNALGAANLSLKISERQNVALLEHKPSEGATSPNDLLAEINQSTKAATKQPIIK